MGPLPTQTFPHAKISPFGVIPKRNQWGKWRLILNLSAPVGASINDGIARLLCSLSYVTVDDIAAAVLALGQGSLLDIKSAYRTVPVHPDDRLLLGMRWNDSLYIDTTLPFGLRSAPKIFCAIADMVEWVIRSTGVPIVTHYIDDFIIIGPPGSSECQQSLQKALQVCSNLGLPVAPHKTEGPSTCMPILGIEVDTQAMELRLPTDRDREAEGDSTSMEDKTHLHEAGAGISYLLTEPFMQSGLSRTSFSTCTTRVAPGGKETASSHSS